MKTLLKGAIVALALTGASFVAAPAIPEAQAQGNFGFFMGPDGARVYFNQGVYRDRAGRRHYYRYPRDYRRYGNDRSWYRDNPRWWRDDSWRRRR